LDDRDHYTRASDRVEPKGYEEQQVGDYHAIGEPMTTPVDDGASLLSTVHEVENKLHGLDEDQTATVIGYVLSSFGEDNLDRILKKVSGVARAAAWSRQWSFKNGSRKT
jgi:hypothetical protein